VGGAPDYAFPHAAGSEARRLELFEQRLDPLTKRRVERLGISPGGVCLEVGGGRGSITRWLSRGRSLLRQIHQLGLTDVGADPEADVIAAGTPLAEFYRLSMAAIGPASVEAGALTQAQTSALVERTKQPGLPRLRVRSHRRVGPSRRLS